MPHWILSRQLTFACSWAAYHGGVLKREIIHKGCSTSCCRGATYIIVVLHQPSSSLLSLPSKGMASASCMIQ